MTEFLEELTTKLKGACMSASRTIVIGKTYSEKVSKLPKDEVFIDGEIIEKIFLDNKTDLPCLEEEVRFWKVTRRGRARVLVPCGYSRQPLSIPKLKLIFYTSPRQLGTKFSPRRP
jgi:hypothetical protein